jgi:hypothetical protein
MGETRKAYRILVGHMKTREGLKVYKEAIFVNISAAHCNILRYFVLLDL